eukprot:COSAG01_NODE_51210_length_356_cov_2.011673_1_plen_56_part_10
MDESILFATCEPIVKIVSVQASHGGIVWSTKPTPTARIPDLLNSLGLRLIHVAGDG